MALFGAQARQLSVSDRDTLRAHIYASVAHAVAHLGDEATEAQETAGHQDTSAR